MERVIGEVVFNDYPDGKFAKKVDWWITPEGIDLIKGWRMQGDSVELIAQKMEIDIRTLRAWRKKHPELEEAITMGKEVLRWIASQLVIIGYDDKVRRFQFTENTDTSDKVDLYLCGKCP